MTIKDVNLGIVDDDNLGDSLRIAGSVINANDEYLQQKITQEEIDRDSEFANLAKLDQRNVFSGNMTYDDFTADASSSVTMSFTNRSPNYYLVSTTDITLNNPIEIEVGKNQSGIIVALAEIVSVGTFWKHSGGTVIGVPEGQTYDKYYYLYFQLDSSTILLSFIGGYNFGL